MRPTQLVGRIWMCSICVSVLAGFLCHGFRMKFSAGLEKKFSSFRFLSFAPALHQIFSPALHSKLLSEGVYSWPIIWLQRLNPLSTLYVQLSTKKVKHVNITHHFLFQKDTFSLNQSKCEEKKLMKSSPYVHKDWWCHKTFHESRGTCIWLVWSSDFK